MAGLGTPSVWRSARTQVHSLVGPDVDAIAIPAFLRKQADVDDSADAQVTAPQYTSLAEMSGAVADHLARGGLVEDLPGLAAGFQVDPTDEGALKQALAELRDLTGEVSTAWLLLALWVAQNPGPDGSPARAAVLVGPVTAAGLIPTDIGRAWQVLEQHLGGVINTVPIATAKPSRRPRLAAALFGASG